MDAITFLETLATHPHYKIHLDGLINQLPAEIKNAYLTQNSLDLKSLLSSTTSLANESHVVQIRP